MKKITSTRREFLKTTGIAAAIGAASPSWFSAGEARAQTNDDRLITGAIGVGGRGSGIARQLLQRSRMVAVCDVDNSHALKFKGDAAMEVHEDYRKLLDRDDIQAVTVGTPDHWHTAIVLRALRAGKDVYCEKPLTLTIDEGKLLCRTVKETGRVLQVGTQQRSEFRRNFLRAVVLARGGWLGKIQRLTVAIGGAPKGGPFEKTSPPPGLNWDLWLGQAPKVDYIRERCHGNFRWWYEYSGGKMTDWGAHHVDIAQWAIGMEKSGPSIVEPVAVTHPVPFKDGYPAADDQYNTATTFKIRCLFDGDIEMFVQDGPGNGIRFEGEKGSIFVGRGSLEGDVIDRVRQDKTENDKLEEGVVKLFDGREPRGHMANFLDAVKDRRLPISDVFTHHRALTTCHLCNIAIRLGRKISWNPVKEQAMADDEINQRWLKRVQRKGYEVV